MTIIEPRRTFNKKKMNYHDDCNIMCYKDQKMTHCFILYIYNYYKTYT